MDYVKPFSREDIWQNIITQEKTRGALVIVTCHDKSILEDVSDVIYNIEHGKITSKQEAGGLS